MKTIILVLAFATLVSCQTPTPNPLCLGLRLQNLTSCASILDSVLSSNGSVSTVFCAGECAVSLRAAYEECGYTGTNNPLETVCNNPTNPTPGIPDPICLNSALQGQQDCLNVLSSDPTAFCTSSCATGVSDAYTRCGYIDGGDPVIAVCGGNFTTNNPLCVAGRLSTLSNCALELLTSPTQFCASECSGSVSTAFVDCGFTGTSNSVTSVCAPGNPIQDPICLGNRLQNLQGCVSDFLMNVSSFCNSECSSALITAYDECGYAAGNPIQQACTAPPPGGRDTSCLAARLTELESCTAELTSSPAAFCNSTCVTELGDAYVDCGFPRSENPSYGVCMSIPSGPDPFCLAERQLGIQSCVSVFLTTPNAFCSSDCYPDLRDAYTSCGYTGINNPFETECVAAGGPDYFCLNRRILNVPQCFNEILTNLTGFCNSECFDLVNTAFTDCGFHNESNPANVCYLSGQGEDPICVQSRIQSVEGCLSGFVYNPTSFCTTQCANSTRMIYNECGYVANNPVDQVCSTSAGSGEDPICLAGNLQSLGHCASVLLTNSTSFCNSECYTDVFDAYADCGYTGFSNPVETACSGNAMNNQDAVCLAGRLQSLTHCAAQLVTDRGTFCSSQCATDLSAAYSDCGYTGFANPAEQGCLNPSTDCVGNRAASFQNCFAEIFLDPNNFCMSQCVSEISSIYTDCGLLASANPVNTFCGGLVPNTPGSPNPVCLSNGLQNLQSCLSSIATNPTGFCQTQCATDLSTAYNECGYNQSNPVNLLCDVTPSNNADLICLTGALQNLQGCISELASKPDDFCNSQCATDLGSAYTNCGFMDDNNPVDTACTGGLPNQELFCVTGKLTSLNDCTMKMNDDDFCGSECEFDLRTAYSECGFTGTTNPIAILCSGTPGNRTGDTICLGSKLQNHQECISELFSNPTSICTDSTCATNIRSAYTDCGYSGPGNPIASTCGQIGGAVITQAIPLMALTFLLLALAAIF